MTQTQLCIVEGPPGSGVTTMLKTFVGEAASHSPRIVAADSWDHAAPMALVRSAIPHTVPTRNVAGNLSLGHGSTNPDIAEIRDAIRCGLEVLESQPHSFFFDNAHLANDCDLDFLVDVRRRNHQPLLVVLGGRKLPSRIGTFADAIFRIRLRTHDESLQLAESLLGVSLGSRLREYVSLAGGNPGAISDLIQAARIDGGLTKKIQDGQVVFDLSDAELPVAVALRIVRPLRRLGANAEVFALAAALCGSIVDVSLATEVAALQSVPTNVLSRLVEAGFLGIESDRVMWQNELIRHAVLVSAPVALRMNLDCAVRDLFHRRSTPADSVPPTLPKSAEGASVANGPATDITRNRDGRIAPSLFEEVRGRQRLTPKEVLVAEALANGHSNREIADQFQMNIRTVETHVRRIFQKLGVQNRTQVISHVEEHGSLRT